VHPVGFIIRNYNRFSIHPTTVIIIELIAWTLKKGIVRFHIQSASFIPHQRMTDLSHRKPASASMSCDSCGAQVNDKSYALYIYDTLTLGFVGISLRLSSRCLAVDLSEHTVCVIFALFSLMQLVGRQCVFFF